MDGGRRLEVEEVAGDRAAVVVEDRREPRLLRYAVFVLEPDVEVLVVGLPQVVGPLGLVAVQEVERLGVGGVAPVGELRKGRVDPGDDAAHLAVGGLRPAKQGR